jgi:hypothetical protein
MELFLIRRVNLALLNGLHTVSTLSLLHEDRDITNIQNAASKFFIHTKVKVETKCSLCDTKPLSRTFGTTTWVNTYTNEKI